MLILLSHSINNKTQQGGKKVLLNAAGRDASNQFRMFHKPEVLQQYAPSLTVGVLAGSPAAGGPIAAAGEAWLQREG